MKAGFHGLTYPKLDAMYGILLSLRRGILWLSPILILVPLAIGVAWKWRNTRIYLVFAVLIVFSFLLLNSSYHYWGGGASIGPRHLTPALAFGVSPLRLPLDTVGKRNASRLGRRSRSRFSSLPYVHHGGKGL
jgi:hypothetical protein